LQKTYRVTVNGVAYTIRQAVRAEVDEALSFDNAVDAEDFLCKACVISPKLDLNTCPASTPSILAKRILEVSGATPEAEAEILQKVQEWSDSKAGKAEILMMATLHYTPEQIEQMTALQWNKAVMAAQLVGQAMGMNVAEFLGLEVPKGRARRRG